MKISTRVGVLGKDQRKIIRQICKLIKQYYPSEPEFIVTYPEERGGAINIVQLKEVARFRPISNEELELNIVNHEPIKIKMNKNLF